RPSPFQSRGSTRNGNPFLDRKDTLAKGCGLPERSRCSCAHSRADQLYGSTDRRFEWHEIRIVKHQCALSIISNEGMNYVFAMIKLFCLAMAFGVVSRPHSSDLVWQ